MALGVGGVVAGSRLRALTQRVGTVTASLRGSDPDAPHPSTLGAAVSLLEEAQTEMCEHAAAVEQRNVLLDRALDQVPLDVVVADRTGAVVYRNRGAERVPGGQAVDPIAEQAVQSVLVRALQGHESFQELDLYGVARRSVVVRGKPLRNDDEIVGSVAILEDVSERRRIDAIRRDFVSNISHELRTPVGALAVIAEAIGAEDSPEVIRRLSARLEIDAHRLSQMLDDLLELSRIEASETPREPVLVERVVTEAFERARAGAERRCVEIELATGPVGLSVMGDRAQLVSAVHNLLDNAVKYTDKNLSVRVDVEALDVGGGRIAEIRVIDHGIGIPQRDRERIFERFYRVDKARTRDTGGTGLGLAIVRHIAVNHRGDVHVDSLEGEGSTFVLRLPALAQTPATADAPDQARTAHQP